MPQKQSYSQFRAMMALAEASFRSMLRSPSSLVFGIVFPLVFIIAFGFIGSGGVHIKVALAKDTDTANAVYQALKEIETIELVADEGEATATALSKGEIDGWIRIAKTPGTVPYTVQVRTTTASPQRGELLLNVLNGLLDRLKLQQVRQLPPAATLRHEVVEGRRFTAIDFVLPGQLGFSLLSTGVFGTAFVFLGLRQTLVIKRFFATPVNRLFIVLGEALSRLLFGLVGGLVVILIGYYFFDFTLISGFWTVIEMLLLSAFGLVVFMGFGFTISGLAKSESVVPPLANIVTLPQFLLSGTFFSTEVFPGWLQAISKLLPLTYLNDALRKISFEGAGLWDIRTELLALLIWGIIVYILAAKMFRWE